MTMTVLLPHLAESAVSHSQRNHEHGQHGKVRNDFRREGTSILVGIVLPGGGNGKGGGRQRRRRAKRERIAKEKEGNGRERPRRRIAKGGKQRRRKA